MSIFEFRDTVFIIAIIFINCFLILEHRKEICRNFTCARMDTWKHTISTVMLSFMLSTGICITSYEIFFNGYSLYFYDMTDLAKKKLCIEFCLSISLIFSTLIFRYSLSIFKNAGKAAVNKSASITENYINSITTDKSSESTTTTHTTTNTETRKSSKSSNTKESK